MTVLRDLTAKIFGSAIAAIALGMSLLPAFGQDTPFVQDEWKYGRRQTGTVLQYCLDGRDADLPVARKIGQAIAQALLLEPKPRELGQNTVGEDIDNLYRIFLESCDVYLGFKLIPDAYPKWLAVTRPYYRTSYVLVTAGARMDRACRYAARPGDRRHHRDQRGHQADPVSPSAAGGEPLEPVSDGIG